MKIHQGMPATFMTILAFAATTLLSSGASAQFGDEIPQESMVPGQVLIRAVGQNAILRIVSQIEDVVDTAANPVEYQQVNASLGLWSITVGLPLSDEEIFEIRAILDDATTTDSEVGWYEPNIYVDVVGGQTGSLWVSGLGIDGGGFKDQFAFELLGVQQARSRSTGRGVMVAIVDTGIDPNHEALGNRVNPFGTSLVDGFLTPWDEPSSNPTSGNALVGHGTFLAGLVRNIAPDVSLLPVRVLDSEGVGTTAIAAAGIEYAVKNGAHIVLLAFGTSVQTLALNTAIDFARDNGVFVVAAAGNEGAAGCFYPGSNPDAFTLVASDHRDQFDPVSSWCLNVDGAAPGSMRILSGGVVDPGATIIGPYPTRTGDQYRAARGTSFAAGLAAGVAALVRGQQPDWDEDGPTNESIVARLTGRMLLGSTPVSLPSPAGDRPRIDAAAAVAAGPRAPDPGDLNGDDCIDAADLGLILAEYGAPPIMGGLHLSDVNGDHRVDSADVGLLLANWRACRPERHGR